MNLRRVKHMLFRLSPEEKVVGIGGLTVLVSAFMPWYSVVMLNLEKGISESGFSGELGVIGFVVFLFTLLGLLFLIAEHLHLRLPNFGFKKEQIILFLMGESTFLLLLTVAIFTKRSLDYTNAEIRFGLYTALVGAFVSAFATFAQMQKQQKKATREFFEHEETELTETPEETMNEEAEIESVEKPEPAKKPEQERFYYEEKTPEVQKKAVQEKSAPEKILAEEVVADSLEFEKESLGIEKTAEVPHVEPTSQGHYFTREADVKPKPEVVAPAEVKTETPESKESANTRLDFYNDL